MRILYHHRTRATDAQRVHILEIISAFRELGHEVRESALVQAETTSHEPEQEAAESGWKQLARKIPFAYDLAQFGYNFVALPMLLRAIWKFKPAFVYERYALANFAGVLAARLTGIPIVLEVNSPFALEQDRDGDIRLVGLARWSEVAICKMSTCVIVVSTPLKRLLIKAGVDEARINVMTNGVNLTNFQPALRGDELRSRFGLQNRTVIGFVGWFRDWHGLDLLLEAFHHARLAQSGAALLMIGDGPEMPNLRRFVQENQLEKDVIFTGPLAHAEIPAHLDLFDIAVQPAANEYCCPMKLIEYMALGKAIVAPRQENIVEIVDEHVNTLLFQPRSMQSMADALSTLVHDAETRRSLGVQARAAIDNHGYLWVRNAARVVDLAVSRA